jgi:NAD(P)-dependent dehydrogenase (short-subunit alcohol dehydrogenase family)
VLVTEIRYTALLLTFAFKFKWRLYSKAANVLLTDEIARREPTIASNSFHPGIVTTNLVGTDA